MSVSRLEYLFDLYIHNNHSELEEQELMSLLAKSENKAAMQSIIDSIINTTGPEMQMADQVAASLLKNIFQKDQGLVIPIKNSKPLFSFWIRVAAAVLFLVGCTYWIFDKKENVRNKVVIGAEMHSPILPGGNRAMLTMSDGSTIILDSLQNGTLIQKGATKISKQGGLLIYNVSASADRGVADIYNTLSTPRGGQYQVILSDGSNVWLNAASSLRFPTAFTGSQRLVELTGEAYFEVAKNRQKPFQVSVGNMRVNVIGTHFNINGYSDESKIKTSLLEGSVKITKGNTSGILKPGEQGVLNKKEDKVEITNPDMNEVLAWKNGLFLFDGADITTIMREIGRWYNVEIIYAGKVPKRRFEGKIMRNAQLSEVLRILELSDIKFTVDCKKIIVKEAF